MEYRSKKELTLLTNILFFNNNEDKFQIMLAKIAPGKSISLRIIDWFVTNFAKEKNISLNNINVYANYKLQLSVFNKQFFDPFARGDRIELTYGDMKIETTIGQMNFFKWLFEFEILPYIEDHKNEIVDHMNQVMRKNKDSDTDSPSPSSSIDSITSSIDSNSSIRRKRKSLTRSAFKTFQKEETNVTLHLITHQ